MPKFSKTSQERLATCHPDLQKVFNEVIKIADCVIVCGHRSEAEQNKAFAERKSKLKFPKSKHNKTPSMAVDVMPLKDGKLDWNDRPYIGGFAKLVMQTAKSVGVTLRWGGDFNMDGNKTTNDAWDMPHYELV